MQVLSYIKLARPDHWFKNIFMLPGILLAFWFTPELWNVGLFMRLPVGFIAACLVASSNYVLNEILDAPSDRHHPVKCARPLASGAASIKVAYVLWLCLAAAGVATGFVLGAAFGAMVLLLWIMGIVYNVRPIRSKDLPYVDVMSEAVNNPIRLALGWYAVGAVAMPPLSVIMAYWMFGSFLMAVKRFAEFRRIDHPERAAQYRKSFAYYNGERLLESIMFYAAFFAMMSGVFVTRYQIELILVTPLVSVCMAYYLHLGFKPDSPVQYPESLWRQKKLAVLVTVTFVACAVLLFIDLPAFAGLFDPWIMPPR